MLDDLISISSTVKAIKRKTTRLEENAKQVGLNINEKKTKIMKINNLNQSQESSLY